MKVPARIPRVVKWAYPECIWQIPNDQNAVYLTFDDGPTPEITDWVMDQLARYSALATFFLIGNNVQQNPEIYQRLVSAGHSIGNHCYNHEKGWTTKNEDYFKSVAQTNYLLQSPLFRPPFGRIKKSQIKELSQHYKIIMWDVLSHDYDKRLSPQECTENVLHNVRSGSIIVFHDSVKAWPNLKESLPAVLEGISKKGYQFRPLDQ